MKRSNKLCKAWLSCPWFCGSSLVGFTYHKQGFPCGVLHFGIATICRLDAITGWRLFSYDVVAIIVFDCGCPATVRLGMYSSTLLPVHLSSFSQWACYSIHHEYNKANSGCSAWCRTDEIVLATKTFFIILITLITFWKQPQLGGFLL